MNPNPTLLATQIERTTLTRIKRQADAWYATPEGQRAVALSVRFAERWAPELESLTASNNWRPRCSV